MVNIFPNDLCKDSLISSKVRWLSTRVCGIFSRAIGPHQQNQTGLVGVSAIKPSGTENRPKWEREPTWLSGLAWPGLVWLAARLSRDTGPHLPTRDTCACAAVQTQPLSLIILTQIISSDYVNRTIVFVCFIWFCCFVSSVLFASFCLTPEWFLSNFDGLFAGPARFL